MKRSRDFFDDTTRDNVPKRTHIEQFSESAASSSALSTLITGEKRPYEIAAAEVLSDVVTATKRQRIHEHEKEQVKLVTIPERVMLGVLNHRNFLIQRVQEMEKMIDELRYYIQVNDVGHRAAQIQVLTVR